MTTLPERLDGLARVAMYAVTQHLVDHELPVPLDIHRTTDEKTGQPLIQVHVYGLGNQQRWINSCVREEERLEPAGPNRIRGVWRMRMECGIAFEVVGHRDGDWLTLVDAAREGVAAS